MSETRGLFSTCCFWDPAINVAESDLTAFINERSMSSLVLRAGQRPMTFWLRPLTNRTVMRDIAGADDDQRRWAAFQASVVKVTDALLRDRAGSVATWIPQYADEALSGRRKGASFVLTDEEMELFDYAVLMEIGEVAVRRAFLPLLSEIGFVLPPTSLQVFNLSRSLLAEMVRGRELRAAKGSVEHSDTAASAKADSDAELGDAAATG